MIRSALGALLCDCAFFVLQFCMHALAPVNIAHDVQSHSLQNVAFLVRISSSFICLFSYFVLLSVRTHAQDVDNALADARLERRRRAKSEAQFSVLVGEIQSGRAAADALRARIAELERALAEARAETEACTLL